MDCTRVIEQKRTGGLLRHIYIVPAIGGLQEAFLELFRTDAQKRRSRRDIFLSEEDPPRFPTTFTTARALETQGLHSNGSFVITTLDWMD